MGKVNLRRMENHYQQGRGRELHRALANRDKVAVIWMNFFVQDQVQTLPASKWYENMNVNTSSASNIEGLNPNIQKRSVEREARTLDIVAYNVTGIKNKIFQCDVIEF